MIDFVLNIFMYEGYILAGIFSFICITIAICIIIMMVLYISLPIIDKIRDKYNKSRRWM